jgi:hypothetical protein
VSSSENEVSRSCGLVGAVRFRSASGPRNTIRVGLLWGFLGADFYRVKVSFSGNRLTFNGTGSHLALQGTLGKC